MKNKLLLSFSKYVSLNVIGMIGLSVYILADTFFVANGIGVDGLAALNLAIAIYSIIHGTGLMLGMGGAIFYNLEKSKGNHVQGDQIFTSTTKLGLILGIIYLVIGVLFSESLATVLGADEITLGMTTTYLKTILCFSPFFIMNNIILAFVRNDGNPRLAMAGMLIGSLSNVVLDYIFIFPLGMGMFGAAFATGIAPIVSLLITSSHFIKGNNKFRLRRGKIDFKLFARISSLGFPSLISEIASGVVLVVFNLLLLGLSGNTAVAAYGVIANLSLIAVAIFTGIGQGVQPLVSEYFGKQNLANVRRLLGYSIILTLGLAALIYGIILLFAGEIVDVFNRDGDAVLRSIGINGLYIYFIGFFFAGLNIFLTAYYSALGQARTGFLVSIMRGIVVIIPTAILLSRLFDVNGVWLAFPVTEGIVCLGAVALLKNHLSTSKIDTGK